MKELAEAVDEPLRKYCQQGEQSWTAGEYQQDGESLDYVLQEEVTIDIAPAEDLCAALCDRDSPHPKHNPDPFYSDDQRYQRLEVSSWQHSERWEEFCERAKHRSRFFDEFTKEVLADIFGEPNSDEAARLPMVEISPDAETKNVFRARRTENLAKAKERLKDPAREVGPPPKKKATAGRMNSTGIPVFYGALSPKTAIAEIRPPLGSIVLVADFRPVRKLRLLDLAGMGYEPTGSIFAPDYEARASRLAFLRGFHHVITRPIQPEEESIDYIPTQIVAEYVSSVLGFDGMLYASTQTGDLYDDLDDHHLRIRRLDRDLSSFNVVFIGEAARVEGSATEDGRSDGTPSLVLVKAAPYNITRIEYGFDPTYMSDEKDEPIAPPEPHLSGLL